MVKTSNLVKIINEAIGDEYEGLDDENSFGEIVHIGTLYVTDKFAAKKPVELIFVVSAFDQHDISMDNQNMMFNIDEYRLQVYQKIRGANRLIWSSVNDPYNDAGTVPSSIDELYNILLKYRHGIMTSISKSPEVPNRKEFLSHLCDINNKYTNGEMSAKDLCDELYKSIVEYTPADDR